MFIRTTILALTAMSCWAGVEEDTVSINKPVIGKLTGPTALAETAASAEEAASAEAATRTERERSSKWMDVTSAGSVRCFCNIPSCVTTGYMCKSEAAGCFSDIPDRLSSHAVYKGRHGCLEYITDKKQLNRCRSRKNYNNVHRKRSGTNKSVLLCCYEDLCNHVDNPSTGNILNDTMLGNLLGDSEARPSIDNIRFRQEGSYGNSDVWFKAATIAVPICGAIILLVLIAMAIRILRSETMSNFHQKFNGVYMPTTYVKPIYDIQYEHYQPAENLTNKNPMIRSPQECQVYNRHIDDLQKEYLLFSDNIDRCENRLETINKFENTNRFENMNRCENSNRNENIYTPKTYCETSKASH